MIGILCRDNISEVDDMSDYNNQTKRFNHKDTIGAIIKGGPLAPSINGLVTFTDVYDGTLVSATIYGLPKYQPASNGKGPIGPFGKWKLYSRKSEITF